MTVSDLDTEILKMLTEWFTEYRGGAEIIEEDRRLGADILDWIRAYGYVIEVDNIANGDDTNG